MKKILAVLTMLLIVLCASAALAADVTLADEEIVIPVGEYRTADYKTNPRGKVAFSVSDESIATVNRNGKLKGVSVGECVLTIARQDDPTATDELTVYVVNPVKKVQVTVPDTGLAVGRSMQAEAVCLPEDATIREVTWSSSRDSVATVDENGVITAHARGTASITARSVDGKARGSVKITVHQLPEEIVFKQDEYTIAVGKKLKFTITVLPRNANEKKVTWTSSDESIATVDRKGTMTALSAGDVTITAHSQADDSITGVVKVHCVIPIKAIAFEQELYDLSVGDTVQLTPVLTPEDATATAMVYSAVNSRICSVSDTGLVTALSGGETTVTVVSAENEKRKASVTVRVNVPVSGVKIDQKGMRLEVGTHAFGNAKMQPLDATNKNMTWVSSDPTVAAVTNTSNRPRVEGYKWGRVLLTGTTVDGGFTASFHVNVGALHEAMVVESAKVKDGQLWVTLSNPSDMHMTAATIALSNGEEADIALDLAPGAVSEPVAVPVAGELKKLSAAVAAWESDTGYHANDDTQKYTYRIAGGLQLWVNVK